MAEQRGQLNFHHGSGLPVAGRTRRYDNCLMMAASNPGTAQESGCAVVCAKLERFFVLATSER